MWKSTLTKKNSSAITIADAADKRLITGYLSIILNGECLHMQAGEREGGGGQGGGGEGGAMDNGKSF